MVKRTGRNQTNWVQMLGVPLTGCVTLESTQALHHSFFHKMWLIIVPPRVMMRIQWVGICKASRKCLACRDVR